MGRYGADLTFLRPFFTFRYNNAFLRDYDWKTYAGGPLAPSVGLGGNISKSIRLVPGETPPPAFESAGEDSGNGSLMRLAPIPIFFASDPAAARAHAARSSHTTHPGEMAAAACELLAYLVASAIEIDPAVPSSSSKSKKAATAPQKWLDARLAAFAALLDREAKVGGSWATLRRLMAAAEPPESTERCWNWRSEQLEIEATLRNRGAEYNGYPVSAGYFGSFSL